MKGKNAAIEVLARFLEGSDNKWLLPVVIVAGVISFSGALGMRATAKGFAVGRPDSLNTGNVEKKARTFFDEENRIDKRAVFSSSVSMAIRQRELEVDNDDIVSVDDDESLEYDHNCGGNEFPII